MTVSKPSILLAATILAGVTAAQTVAPHSAQKAEVGKFGFDETGMDRSVKPGDDFYEHANGAWLKRTIIPADQPATGTYYQAMDRALLRTRHILEADPASRIGRAYASYLDTARVEALGLAPIRRWLARIAAVNDRAGFATLQIEADAMKIAGPIVYWPWQDDQDPTQAVLMIDQGGLGLGDRTLYLNDDAASARLREAYVAHLARMLALAGERDATVRAKAVLAFETEIARVHWSAVDYADMVKTYHMVPLDKLAAFSTPTLDLARIVRSHAPRATRIQVREPSAIRGIAALYDRAPLAVLKDQMILRSLDGLSEALPAAFDQETFAFYGTTLAGTPQQEARWKRAVAFANDALRDDVGKAYVARYFPPDYKAKLNALVDNMKAAMAIRIDRLAWMQPATKARAKAKLANLTVRVGYPDKWRSYDGLEIRADDRFGNRVRANRFDFRYAMDRASAPTRIWEWGYFGAQKVEANANFNLLQLTFPAGFLQPPIFDPYADPAINYGAVGAVAAHEISHNFDDSGAKYDEHGLQRDWWSPGEVTAFEKAGDALIAQSSAFEVVPGLHANGKVSLGENISDLAGLTIAYDAYKASLGGKPAPVIDGLTGDQRFFLGWAQFFRVKARDDYWRQYLLTWHHAPDKFRAMTVRNIDAWYEAFDVKPGDKMYLAPEQRVRVW